MAFPVFNRHRSEAFDQNSLGKKVVRGFVGQRLTGNRGSFFLSLSSELRERGVAGLEPANHGKGPRANLEDGDFCHTHTHTHTRTHTHPARKRAMHLPFFFSLPFLPHQLHDVGARGAKELGGLWPRK